MSNKPRIKLYDSVFSDNGVAIGSRKPPTHFDWYKGDEWCKVAVFTENHLRMARDVDAEVKVALIIESPAIDRGAYEYMVAHAGDFNIILTHQKQLAEIIPDVNLYCLGGCWIEKPMIYDKCQDLSMIFSSKRETQGQRLRHAIYEELYTKPIHFYGRGHKGIPEIPEKLEGLRDYRYSIAIENCDAPVYFTEKLIDCFATGTIPIYWGCSGIGNHFDTRGMIIIKNISDLKYAIREVVSEKHYNDECTLKAITDNYHAALEHIIVEDWLWTHYFKDMV
jgi:hypothetical protein